jgi:hypothetical protein
VRKKTVEDNFLGLLFSDLLREKLCQPEKGEMPVSQKQSALFDEDGLSYKQYPQLAKYIDRIGAEESTFRRFMVKETRSRGYYIERCIIRITRDAEITVTNKDYAPSKEEAKAITEELLTAKFPTSVHFTEAQRQLLVRHLKNAPGLYFFADRDRRHENEFTFAQQRIETDDGKKYLPWTFWSDGKFRRMEPDSGLPFWKPYPPRGGDEAGGRKVMVHEGAKTASFVDDLVNNPDREDELKAHPYGEVFKNMSTGD